MMFGIPSVLAVPAAFAAVLWLDVRRRRFDIRSTSPLSLLDLLAPALAAAAALTRLYAGPEPEWPFFSAGTFVAVYLWQRGERGMQRPLAEGVIAAELLIAAGLAGAVRRLALDAGTAAASDLVFPLMVAALGLVLLVVVRRRFRRRDSVRRVLDHVVRHGSTVKPEYHRATPECPEPDRWRMLDTMTAEVEVLELLRSLVVAVKPRLVVETGTFLGISTLYMAEGLRENGFGRIVTCDPDPEVFARASEKMNGSGLGAWIDHRCQPSLEIEVPGTIDLLFCDSLPELREPEVRHFLPRVNPNGLILMHDASSHLRTVREAALRMEKEGLISVLLLPTPRGLVIAQKRDRTP
jgi:predicted O-methyltransferase YrrM